MKYLLIALIILSGCQTTYPALDATKGRIVQRDGNRVTVVFPQKNGPDFGYADFWLPDGVDSLNLIIRK